MTVDPTTLGFAMPKGDDPIAAGDNAIRTNAQAAVALYLLNRWKYGLLPASDLNALNTPTVSGTHILGATTVYGNAPFTGAGQIRVDVSAAGPGYQEAIQYATGATFRRSLTNPFSNPKQWGVWRRTDSDYLGLLPSGSDADVLSSVNDRGTHALGASATYTNIPFDTAGQIRVDVVGSGPGYQEAVEYATGVTFRRSLTDPYSSPAKWGAWRRTDSAPTGVPRLPDPGAPLEADTSLVTMWGDSLTHAGGVAARLAALEPGVAVVNRGQSGQHSAQIAARQGGSPSILTVLGGVIPANGSVAVEHYTSGVLIESGYPARSLTGYLAGVHGTLSVPAGSVAYTFTRTSPGASVEIPEGAPFWTDHGITARRGAQVIWMGRNNLATHLPGDYLPHMLEHLSPARKRVVVLSATNAPDEGIGTERYDLFRTANAQLRAMAGECFLDVRRWLIDEGLAAAGITPTTEDTAAVAADAVPPSLTSDGVHFTSAAQIAIGTWLHAQLESLGWWQ